MCFKPEHLEDDDEQPIDHKPSHILLVTNLVDELVISVVNSRIYWHDHPRVSGSLEEVMRLLESYLELTRQDSLTLGILDDCLVLDRRPLLGATLSAPRIIEPLKRFGESYQSLAGNANVLVFLLAQPGQVVVQVDGAPALVFCSICPSGMPDRAVPNR